VIAANTLNTNRDVLERKSSTTKNTAGWLSRLLCCYCPPRAVETAKRRRAREPSPTAAAHSLHRPPNPRETRSGHAEARDDDGGRRPNSTKSSRFAADAKLQRAPRTAADRII